MNAVRMTTLDNQRQKLENEIIKTKEKIWSLKTNDFPNLAMLNQLKDQVERNMQLINMIDQHIHEGGERCIASSKE